MLRRRLQGAHWAPHFTAPSTARAVGRLLYYLSTVVLRRRLRGAHWAPRFTAPPTARAVGHAKPGGHAGWFARAACSDRANTAGWIRFAQ